MQGGSRVTVRRRDFDAALFDLDGVLTETARLHAAAWKVVFDAFLRSWADRHGETFRAFDDVADYLAYVDGRPRDDGIRCFLRSRGISLPEGRDEGSTEPDSVRALGERKVRFFRENLQAGIKPAPGAEALLQSLRRASIKTAVASSSKNCAAILHASGLDQHIDASADGLDVERLRLPGKPDPALFMEAARRVGAQPDRAILFEDALAGVEAGRRGGFGRVVAVNRGGQAEALLERGADIVIQGLLDVDVENG